jgi:hypothetical protein
MMPSRSQRAASLVVLLALCATVLAASEVTASQQLGASARQQKPLGSGEGELPSFAEINRLFDAYAVMQAQDALQLGDPQFGPFVTRLKALQDARRRHFRLRTQIVQDLARMTRPDSQATEEMIRERLEALLRQEEAGQTEIKRAHARVDELLDVRQRARFRVFEDQLDRKKFELLARARQQRRANRAARPPS